MRTGFPGHWSVCGRLGGAKGAIPVSIGGMEIDIGLVDIAVFFERMPGNKVVLARTPRRIVTNYFVRNLSTSTGFVAMPSTIR